MIPVQAVKRNDRMRPATTMKRQHTALVTGGTGYIGQALVAALTRDSAVTEVRIVTRERRRAAIPADATANICFCEGDIRDAAFVERCMSGVTLVFHLAALTPPISANVSSEELESVNVHAPVLLATAAAKSGAQRFVHFSTTGLYGRTKETLLNEDSPCAPPNVFERSKLRAERALSALAPQTAIGLVILRPSNVIGGNQPRQRLLPLMRSVRRRRVLLTYPSGWQNLVYLGDVVDAAVRLGMGDAPMPSPAVYNVNCPLSNDVLVSELAQILGVPSRFPRVPMGLVRAVGRVADALSPPLSAFFSKMAGKIDQLVDRRVYDAARLRLALPQWPATGIHEGLALAARYYRQHGWL